VKVGVLQSRSVERSEEFRDPLFGTHATSPNEIEFAVTGRCAALFNSIDDVVVHAIRKDQSFLDNMVFFKFAREVSRRRGHIVRVSTNLLLESPNVFIVLRNLVTKH
jgi:hypothetical protein